MCRRSRSCNVLISLARNFHDLTSILIHSDVSAVAVLNLVWLCVSWVIVSDGGSGLIAEGRSIRIKVCSSAVRVDLVSEQISVRLWDVFGLPVKVFLLFRQRYLRLHGGVRLRIRNCCCSLVYIHNFRIDILIVIFNSVNVNTSRCFQTLGVEWGDTAFSSHGKEADIARIESQVLIHIHTWCKQDNFTLVSTSGMIEGAHTEW